MPSVDRTYIVGAYEHPTRRADNVSVAQLHAEVALGALADCGLSTKDVDGYFCGADAPGIGAMTMAEYIGLSELRYIDTTESGGSSYILHLDHALRAIATGQCNVALIAMADRPLSSGIGTSLSGVDLRNVPAAPFQPAQPFPPLYGYAMVARRHMYEFGTTPEQLAWVKVAASHHAQYNENAKLRNVVSVEDVLASPMVAAPLHKLDCCVITDGGGAIVVAREEIARNIRRPLVRVAGAGSAISHTNGGWFEITSSAGISSGRTAFVQAGVTPKDIGYASIYDSFTISVIVQLEDLGFCEKGKGGRFVADGNLISGIGRLAFNTDGGGLCSNHPGNKGGMTKLLEAVRQCRGEAHPAVQVTDREVVLAHGTGGLISGQHVAGTAILISE